MTMFSMKPKFDLAAFLAVPAPDGAARRRYMKRNGMQFQSATNQERAESESVTDLDQPGASIDALRD